MKSRLRRTPVKKPKPQPRPNMENNPEQLDLEFDVGGASVTSPSSDVYTITIDPTLYSNSIYTSDISVSPCVSYGSGSSYTWANTDYSISSGASYVNIDADGVKIREGGDIKVGDKSLTKAIEAIEERLGILHPNPALEDKWEQLKELRKQYIELEKDILEKEKIMDILKK